MSQSFYGTMDLVMGQSSDQSRRGWLVACAALVIPVLSCSSAALCEPIVIEELDPLSSQHVIAGTEVVYLTDPPTSGPHLGAPSLFGALDAPVSRPMQVTILESGRTLVQYDAAALEADALVALEQIAGERIVIAPAVDLTAPLVVTRWRTKAACSGVDLDAIRHFAERDDVPVPASDLG